MPERTHICNHYSPAEALEVFSYIEWVLLQRRHKRWCLPKRDLPPRGSPLRKLLRCVLMDLEKLGFASKQHGIYSTGKRTSWYLNKEKWKYLLNCKWVCATCPHITNCPLGALFKSKGWPLPGEEDTSVTTGEKA